MHKLVPWPATPGWSVPFREDVRTGSGGPARTDALEAEHLGATADEAF